MRALSLDLTVAARMLLKRCGVSKVEVEFLS